MISRDIIPGDYMMNPQGLIKHDVISIAAVTTINDNILDKWIKHLFKEKPLKNLKIAIKN